MNIVLCFIVRSVTQVLELDYRSHKRGGGVSLYLHESLQYKSRKDLIIGGEINSVFVEVDKSSLNVDRNIIIGLVYRPPKNRIRIRIRSSLLR